MKKLARYMLIITSQASASYMLATVFAAVLVGDIVRAGVCLSAYAVCTIFTIESIRRSIALGDIEP